MNAREIIRKVYGSSKNFMTPDVIKYGKISKYTAFELSCGRGIFDNYIYGVSVATVEKDGKGYKNYDLSGSFDIREKAESYIKKLKKRYG